MVGDDVQADRQCNSCQCQVRRLTWCRLKAVTVKMLSLLRERGTACLYQLMLQALPPIRRLRTVHRRVKPLQPERPPGLPVWWRVKPLLATLPGLSR